MSAVSALRSLPPLRSVAVAGLLITAIAPAAGSSLAGSLPSPRVLPLQARVVALRPRIVSVAPQQTKPNSYTVPTDVLFAFGSSQLSSSAQAVLAAVIGKLQNAKPGTVLISGYTDDIGTVTYNLGLSQHRAASVETYLKSHVSNAALGYQTRGLGEADPVAPNALPNGQDNPPGRAKNRRVVITYTPR